MATLTTIQETDLVSASRAVINSNFTALNAAKVDGATALVSAGKLVKVTSAGIVGESIASESGGTLHVSGDLKLNGGASAVLYREVSGPLFVGHNVAGAGNDLWLVAGGAAALSISGATGNVGIGTTTPAMPLHVQTSSNSAVGALIANVNSGSSAYSYLQMGNNGDSGAGLVRMSTTNASYAGPGGLSMFTFGAYPVGIVTDNQQRLIVTGGGDVGIGTTSPQHKLHVVGNGLIDGILLADELFCYGPVTAVNVNAGFLHARGDAGSGSVDLITGNTSASGYVEWWIPGPVRLAYMGYSDASAMRLALENVAKFEITGAPVEIKAWTGVDALRVYGGSPTKYLTVRPEITANTCELGYWDGTAWQHLLLERVTVSSHGIRFNDLTVQTTAMTTDHRYRTLGITIDGGGSAITTGSKGYVVVPFACTIDQLTVVADQTSSVSVDVKRSTYAAFPTTTSIVGAGNKPALSSARKSQATPSGWTATTLSAGDVIEFVVDSAATVTRVNVSLRVTV